MPDAVVVVFLDLETSGLSILTDNIVEIGVVDEYGATFSTVVRPPILPAGPTVHGIDESELRQGPTLACAFERLARFLDNLAENVVSDGESSADELMALPSLKSELPSVALVAHNGMRFTTLTQVERESAPEFAVTTDATLNCKSQLVYT